METVKVEVSGIIHAATSTVWRNVCLTRFSSGMTQFSPLEGISSCGLDYRNIPLRKLQHVGEGRLCEELTLLDHENYEMRYKLVSDVNNKNPFPATFLGYRCSIRLHNVTTDKATFMRIFCAFKTEKEAAGMMKATWERIHLDVLQAVKQQSLAAGTVDLEMLQRPLASMSDILVGPSSRLSSLDSTPSPLHVPLDTAQTIFRLESIPAAAPGEPGHSLAPPQSHQLNCISPQRSSLLHSPHLQLEALPPLLPPNSQMLSRRAMSISPTSPEAPSGECWSQRVYLKAFKERVLSTSAFGLGAPQQHSVSPPQQWLSGQMQTSTSL